MKSLSTGALPEYLSPYIKNLIESTGGTDGPIGKQFIFNQQSVDDLRDNPAAEYDPQEEELYEVAPGMIYKYKGTMNADGTVAYFGRVLWTISRYCATYCRFCFRGRFVGLPAVKRGVKKDGLSQKPFLTKEDIDIGIGFIAQHREINEVILSGGDPFVVPERYVQSITDQLVQLQQSGDIDVIRFHTRAPVTNPYHIKDWHYNMLNKIHVPHIVLHINHPFEITEEVKTVVKNLRQTGAVLLSQSVLLKDVNDDVHVLHDLFTGLIKIGVVPYYLHQNDPVTWAREFTVPFDRAVQLWHQLRPRLSGLAASAKFVIDAPHGVGKVVVPEAGWLVNFQEFTDFTGKLSKTL